MFVNPHGVLSKNFKRCKCLKSKEKKLADLNNITASVYIGPFFMISLFDGSLRWESGLQPTLSKECKYRVRLWNIRK